MLKRDRNDLDPSDLERFRSRINGMKGQQRNPAPLDVLGGSENIREFLDEFRPGPFIAENRDAFLLNEIKAAKLVDAMGVVGMGMSVEDCIQARDLRSQSLLAKVGRRIDEKAFSAKLDPRRGPEALVLGVPRATDSALALKQRHATRCSTAQDSQRRFHDFI